VLLEIGEHAGIVALRFGGSRQPREATQLTPQIAYRLAYGKSLSKILGGLRGRRRVNDVPAKLAQQSGLLAGISQLALDLERRQGILVGRFILPLEPMPLTPCVEGTSPACVPAGHIVGEGLGQIEHLPQVTPLGVAVTDPTQHLGSVAQDIEASGPIGRAGQKIQETIVGGQGRLMSKEPTVAFRSTGQVMDGRLALTGGDVVMGQPPESLREEGFQGLCDPSMKPLTLPRRRSLVDGSPHLLVAETIARIRLDQESQAEQVIGRRRV
jgi:hypothetical protein